MAAKSNNPKPLVESILVNKTKQRADAQLALYTYRDADTRQMVMVIPSLDLTAYGANLEKAEKMMDFVVADFFANLLGMKQKEIDSELSRLGWEHVKNKNKRYSRAFVDSSGELKQFAVANEVLVTQEAITV